MQFVKHTIVFAKFSFDPYSLEDILRYLLCSIFMEYVDSDDLHTWSRATKAVNSLFEKELQQR